MDKNLDNTPAENNNTAVTAVRSDKSVIIQDNKVSDSSNSNSSSCIDCEAGKSETSDNFESNTCCYACCKPEKRIAMVFVRLTACMLAGIVFGFALEKSRVFEPASIRYQMIFTRWIMLKMFLAAVGTGQLCLGVLYVIPPLRHRVKGAILEYVGCFANKGIITSALGPFILGSGMTLSGACPGMVLAQVGSWTKNAYLTFIGVLIGALVYGLFAPFIIKISRPKKPLPYQTIHETFKLPYAVFALPMAVLLGVVVFLLEYFIPWRDDLEAINRNNDPSANIFTVKSWPPFVAGILVGVLQLVIVFAAGDTLGGSSSYVTLVSQWVVGEKLEKTFPYLAKARYGLGNWWQVFYVGGAILGGLFSSLASHSIATTKGANIPTALCGGFMMLIGARLAAGCTSGHGLSGMALLAWLSFIAVPFMFAGGIVTAFSMQATGALCDFDCPALGQCSADIYYC